MRFLSGEDIEQDILRAAVIEPDPYELDFNTMPAGVVKFVGSEIWQRSAPPDTEELLKIIEGLRQGMSSFEAQAENIICAVFPSIMLEETRKWPYSKLIEYAVRAEWILRNIHGLPVELGRTSKQPVEKVEPGELRKQGIDPMSTLTPAQLRPKPMPDRIIVGSGGWRLYNTSPSEPGQSPQQPRRPDKWAAVDEGNRALASFESKLQGGEMPRR